MHPIHHFLRRARLGGGGRLAAGVALAAGLLTGAASADASTGGFDVPEPLLAVARAMEKQARDAEDLRVDVVTVTDGTRAGERTFDVVVDGAPLAVTLRPFSVRTDETMAYEVGDDGVMVPVELPPSRTYRGEVAGRPGMVAAATLMPGGSVRAVLHEPGTGTWAIEPVVADIPGLPASVHAVYRADAIQPDGSVCGTTEVDRVAPADVLDAALLAEERARLGAGYVEAAEQEIQLGGADSRTAVLIDADYEYYELNGFSTVATIIDIETLMNAVGLIYQQQAGICYSVPAFIIRTTINDPYDETTSSAMLNEFREVWNGVSTPSRDTAHLFTGRDPTDGSVVGRAYLGVICSQANGYGFSQAQYTTNFTNRTQLIAHELGHNWNACHCNVSDCTGGGADADCGIMNSSINGSTDFGNRSLNTIESHRAGRDCLSSCFSPHYVDDDAGFIQSGSSIFPWDDWEDGYEFVTVGGLVLMRSGSYPETGTYSKRVTIGNDGGGTATIGD